jgi:flagellar hook-basal body complex protein FliE
MERIDGYGVQQPPPLLPENAGGAAGAAASGGGSFSNLIESTIKETERLQSHADGMVKSFAQGEITDVHQVMLAMNRADLSFRMMLEVRNKLLDAYQEVMRMQV